MTDLLSFAGKTVLVVGGTGGIGNAVAHGFRLRGADVWITGTRPGAQDYADDPAFDGEGLTYRQMLSDNATSVQTVADALPRLDVLVLVQGTNVYGRKEYGIETFRRVVDVNLNSVMLCATSFLGALAATRGNIVMTGSVAGFRAAGANPAYSASKAAIIGLVRSLAQAWAGEGVRVNAIAPGLVETKMIDIITGHQDRYEQAVNAHPQGRLAQPSDMVGPILFLASPLAAFVTGQTLIVDGGQSL